jgi:hypothetical protein
MPKQRLCLEWFCCLRAGALGEVDQLEGGFRPNRRRQEGRGDALSPRPYGHGRGATARARTRPSWGRGLRGMGVRPPRFFRRRIGLGRFFHLRAALDAMPWLFPGNRKLESHAPEDQTLCPGLACARVADQICRISASTGLAVISTRQIPPAFKERPGHEEAPHVIVRSLATKQSILSCAARWIASLKFAMTAEWHISADSSCPDLIRASINLR